MKFHSENLTRVLGEKSLILQEKSPQLLFATGLVCFGATVFTASTATLKVGAILDEATDNLEKIKTVENMEREDYTEKDAQKDTVIVYTQTAIKLVKVYGPAIIFGTASIFCLTKSHNIQSDRIAAVTAAYAAVDKAFTAYRERVRDRYGEDVDREMRYGSQKVEVTNPETGRKKTVTRVGPFEPSMYAKFFDKSSSRNWSKDPASNYVFVRANQRYANDLLVARGHVFLNEVYDMLGLDRTTAGQAVGWRHIQGNEGDNFIDFGLFRDDQTVRDFMNGDEGSILLDFNVDGVIWDKIDTPHENLSWQNPL